MNIVCLDMEGVLVPETGTARRRAVSRSCGAPPVTSRTMTADALAHRHSAPAWTGADGFRTPSAALTSLPGAREFLDRLRTKAQVVDPSATPL